MTPTANSAHAVLVVDDEEGLRSLLSHQFTREGFDVETASNGRQALEKLTHGSARFDAMILDVSMPKMGGFEVLQHLRDLDIDPITIVLSGRIDEDQRRRATELGTAELIEKPIGPADLVARLRENLDREG